MRLGPQSRFEEKVAVWLSGDCQACQDNYHELIGFGNGEDFISEVHPDFGKDQKETLKLTHLFASSVSSYLHVSLA